MSHIAIRWTQERLKLLAARALNLLERPAMDLSPDKAKAFDALLQTIQSGTITDLDYALPYPKYEFLRYVVDSRQMLLHGSNHPNLMCLEPRPQTLFFGEKVHAVFATPDDIWCMFYAIVNNRGFTGSKRNGCIRVTKGREHLRKFYWFSLSEPMLRRDGAFCDGTVYLLPAEPFVSTRVADEWISHEPVEPIAKLAVEPGDFPFLANITSHSDSEPMWRFLARRLFRTN